MTIFVELWDIQTKPRTHGRLSVLIGSEAFISAVEPFCSSNFISSPKEAQGGGASKISRYAS